MRSPGGALSNRHGLLLMDIPSFISLVFAVLKSSGIPGAVVLVLMVTNIVLWRALGAERVRSQTLVDKMLIMSQEVSVMIERIAGR